MPRAEAAAAGVRRDLGIEDDAQPDMEVVARSLRAELVFERMARDVSGLLIREGERAIIGINGGHPESRQRFTIAHELGHLLLHRGRPLVVDSLRVNLRDSRSSLATDLEEIEANSFAAELLMPRALVLRSFRRRVDAGASNPTIVVKDLAHGFGVSDEAMRYRLDNLGLTGPTR